MKRMPSAPFMPGCASGSMWMWKAQPTRGSMTASGAKKLTMLSRVVQANQASSSVVRKTTSFSMARSAACASSAAAHDRSANTLLGVAPCWRQ